MTMHEYKALAISMCKTPVQPASHHRCVNRLIHTAVTNLIDNAIRRYIGEERRKINIEIFVERRRDQK